MPKCICGSYHCEICGNHTTEIVLGHYQLHPGDMVELDRPLKVLRKTKEGLILCEIYGREISIPEYMLRHKGLVTGQHMDIK